jgi:hypothetical protein
MDDSANKGIKFRVALKAEYVFRSWANISSSKRIFFMALKSLEKRR